MKLYTGYKYAEGVGGQSQPEGGTSRQQENEVAVGMEEDLLESLDAGRLGNRATVEDGALSNRDEFGSKGPSGSDARPTKGLYDEVSHQGGVFRVI